MITRTHNAYHLGDNLVHLHFMRKVALANPDRQFIHAAQWQYLSQLKDLVVDIPNLGLTDFNYMTPPDSIDAWRGANGFWYQSEIRNDFVRFHIEQWFPHLAERLKVENPIKCAKDMLFDYPAINEPKPHLDFKSGFDVLVISSRPGSGQFQGYDESSLVELAKRIQNNGSQIITTSPAYSLPHTHGLSVTDIGALSLHCHTILMISTGPSWPTFNIWNQDTVMNRIILLEPERVNLAPNTTHCATIDEAAEVLKGVGLL